MTRVPRLMVTLVGILASTSAFAASAVFDGDPRDPATQAPYEILPGHPLVLPGPDGIPGTADDVINTALIGDIDVVVRAGVRSADPVIPPPAAASGRGGLPTGVAGPPGAGGTAIPFTVFLSTGVVSAAEPAGRLLSAADMNGVPVIVAAFPDLDGDGMIGPTSRHGAEPDVQLRELEPVGRAAALFSGGLAHGELVVRRGLPPSRGGLTVVLGAMAVTGPFDPAFLDGVIPSGPAISTALPFLPIRDLNRLIRDRPAAAGPDTTLQDVIQLAAVPEPDQYAIPLDGSSPTVDAAVVMSQPAVRVAFRRSRSDTDQPLHSAVLGTRGFADRLNVRLLAVDRFDNPADPPADWRITLRADDMLRISGYWRRPRALPVGASAGRRILARLKHGTGGGTHGTLWVERDGVAVAALAVTVDERANRPVPDLIVPSAAVTTIQQAIDTATDLNGDGTIAVRIGRGVFREHLRLARAIDLSGAGAGATYIVGDGTTTAIGATASGVVMRDLTVVGGAPGIELAGNGARLVASTAWRNVGPGVVLSAPGTELWASSVEDNGGAGVSIGAVQGARCLDGLVRGNQANGISVQSGGSVQVLDNEVLENNGSGVTLLGADDAQVRRNQSVLNIGAGIEIAESARAVVAENVCAANDDAGLRMDRADGALVTVNTLENNNGYGIFTRRSPDADFDAAAGVQDPPGDNASTGNRKGDVFVRPD